MLGLIYGSLISSGSKPMPSTTAMKMNCDKQSIFNKVDTKMYNTILIFKESFHFLKRDLVRKIKVIFNDVGKLEKKRTYGLQPL